MRGKWRGRGEKGRAKMRKLFGDGAHTAKRLPDKSIDPLISNEFDTVTLAMRQTYMAGAYNLCYPHVCGLIVVRFCFIVHIFRLAEMV